MNVLFAGTTSAFSVPPLQALLASQHTVVGIVAPKWSATALQASLPTEVLPLLPAEFNHTIIGLARAHGVPLMGLRDAPRVDVIVVACFPRRLPAAFLELAAHAALNIHPSWLPEFRGPAPLFWQLRAGIADPGVTLHHLTAELDAGAIVAQTRVQLPAGASGPQADRLLSSAGAELLLRALDQEDFSARPQGAGGSYQSWPREGDWQVPTEWPVRRAYNFLRGTEEWGHLYMLATADGPLAVRAAIGYHLGNPAPGAARREAGGWSVGFADGWLVVR